MTTGVTLGVPDTPVAIKAFRVWALRETAKGPRLRSIWFPDDRTWPAYERFTAECNVCLFRPMRHRAPKPGHTCGIYAMKTVEDVWLWALDNTPPGGRPVVCGEVWCWGTVVEGELGYRAQHAYPAAFLGAWFAAPRDGARALKGLSAAYGVPVEHRDDFPAADPGWGSGVVA